MNVALVVPPYQGGRYFLQPPLGMLGCKKVLSEADIRADIIDLRLLQGERVCSIPPPSMWDAYEMLVVCTSELDVIQNYFLDYRLQIALDICRDMKSACPQKSLTVVGPHATVAPKIVLEQTSADCVVVGEWELAVLRIAKQVAHSHGEFPKGIVMGEPGFLSQDYVLDYSEVPFERYYGYDIGNPGNGRVFGWSIIQGSRGCPCHCTYCYNFYGRQVSFQSPTAVCENVCAQVDWGAQTIFFIDNCLGIDKDWLHELCKRLITRDNQVRLICQTRAGLLEKEDLCLMKAAGFYGIWYGVESFDNKVLRAVKKGITAEQSKRALAATREAGIVAAAFMMEGLPEQDVDSVRKDLDYLRSHGYRYNLSLLQPRPGTKLYEEACSCKDGPSAQMAPERLWGDALGMKGSPQQNSALKVLRLKEQYGRKRLSVYTDSNIGFHRFDQEIKHDMAIEGKREHYAYTPEQKASEDRWVPFLSFPITKKCNFHCVYCGQGGEATASTASSIPLNEIVRTYELARKHGIKKFRITGGEPLTHPDIRSILKFFSDQGVYLLVNTNGSLISRTEGRDSLLSNIGDNVHFAVSLDTLREDRFKIINGARHQLSDVLDGIRLLAQCGLLLRVNMVYNKFNKDEVYDIIDFCRELGCDLKLLDVVSVPVPFSNRQDVFIDINPLEKELAEHCDKVLSHEYSRGFGTPCFRYQFGTCIVTMKNSTAGSHYDREDICASCPDYPCHEGLYDIFCLADGRLCSCRWTEAQKYGDREEQLKYLIDRFRKSTYALSHSRTAMRVRSELV